MKANRKFGMWKAIAFLTVVISLFSCTPSEVEIFPKPEVLSIFAENIGITSATIGAYIIPNGEADVYFEYQIKDSNSNWVLKKIESKFTGSSKVVATSDLPDLEPSTLYNFRVTVSNKGGSITVGSTGSFSNGSFKTLGLTKAIVAIKDATDVKINSVTLNAIIIPYRNSSVAFQYRTENSDWITKTLSGNFDGTDSIKVSYNVPDLDGNTVYYYRITVNNEAGPVFSYADSFQTYAVSDYDGNYYHTVTTTAKDVYDNDYQQTWLKENLRTTHYANGDPIANVTSASDWAKLSTPAYCYYNNNSDYAQVYGALYNWYVGADKRELISGWHTPTIYEFVDLDRFLGAYYITGPAVMDDSKLYWTNLSESYRKPNNSTGLSIMPNGDFGIPVNSSNFSFMDLGTSATLWSSDADSDDMASCAVIDAPENYFSLGFLFSAKSGYGLRLLKN